MSRSDMTFCSGTRPGYGGLVAGFVGGEGDPVVGVRAAHKSPGRAGKRTTTVVPRSGAARVTIVPRSRSVTRLWTM